MDNLRTTSGQPMENLRTIYGQPTDNLRTTYGQPTDNLRAVYGQPTGNLRTTYGQPTDNLQTTYEQSPDNLRTAKGQLLIALYLTDFVGNPARSGTFSLKEKTTYLIFKPNFSVVVSKILIKNGKYML